MAPSNTTFDCLVIGAGPAGATAALRMARRGLSVAVIERDPHPRFHIGESFLPRNTGLVRDLGLEDRLAAIPQTVKKGASFALGGEKTLTNFRFDNGTPIGDTVAWNIERAPFDKMLADAARDAGAEIHEGVTVTRIERLAHGDVALATSAGEFRGRYLLDASGQGTVIGRHLNTRRLLPDLQKVAYFGHFKGLPKREGDFVGYPIIIMCREGWFWFIPITPETMSIGLVMDHALAKGVMKEQSIAPTKMLAWGIARCPMARQLVAEGTGPETNYICADFSYTCKPYAGPGYFLIGDAATFVDPIFSTGVCLGMMSGAQAADAVHAILKENADPAPLMRAHAKYVDQSSSAFFRLVRRYYRHEFRELFLHGQGPVGVHRAILALLAGHVFPRPPFKVRWRARLFEWIIRIHSRRPLVPRRAAWSLIEAREIPSEEVLGRVDPWARASTA